MENENNKPDNNTNNNSTNFLLADDLVDAMLQRQCEQLLEQTLENSMKDCIANMAVQIQAMVSVANYFIENHLNITNTSPNSTTDVSVAGEDNTTTTIGDHHEVDSSSNESI